MWRRDIVRWLKGRALRDSGRSRGWSARAATRVLCWLVSMPRFRPRGRSFARTAAIEATVTLVHQSPDDQLRSRAQRALEARWEDPDVAYRVVYCLSRIGLNPATTDFLLTPAPSCSHLPKVKLVDLLRDEIPGSRLHTFGERVIEAALDNPDEGIRSALTELLCETDHPHLLNALMETFGLAFDRLVRGTTAPVGAPDRALWRADQPTELTRICAANRHLPPAADRSRSSLLLSLIKDGTGAVPEYLERLEPYGAVSALLAVRRPAAPYKLVRDCRKVLRSLEPGPARDALCQYAMDGQPVARQTVVKAGHLPDERRFPRFLFFYLTEQWERYDEVDPDGALMREWFARHLKRGATAYSDSHLFSRYSWDISRIAAKTGRPDPRPERAVSRSRKRSPQSAGGAATGSYVDSSHRDGAGVDGATDAGGGHDGGFGGYSDGGSGGYSSGFSGGVSY